MLAVDEPRHAARGERVVQGVQEVRDALDGDDLAEVDGRDEASEERHQRRRVGDEREQRDDRHEADEARPVGALEGSPDGLDVGRDEQEHHDPDRKDPRDEALYATATLQAFLMR